MSWSLTRLQRGETDFFSGEPLRALSTLVFSDNIDLQRSASLTFAEITERGAYDGDMVAGSMLRPQNPWAVRWAAIDGR